MSAKIQIAAIQMRSAYGEVAANLAKAEGLVRSAAEAGAKLIVLPELFNTGYGYTPANYVLAETRDEQTYTWITRLAATLGVHLAGSFLLRKDSEIFNTLLLAAPDGQTWEYDKTHPWGWERAYFCPGAGPLIAKTSLGNIGLLICYDVAFPDLFAAYAGKIQLLLVSSCPPRLNYMKINFPSGCEVTSAETGAVARAMQTSVDLVFDENLRAQSAWLGVPMVNAMPYGDFASQVPRPKLSFGTSVMSVPRLWKLIGQADEATISSEYFEHTMIAGADGAVLTRPGEGDSFALAEVPILEAPPQPAGPQPQMDLHPAARWVSSLLSWLVKSEYKQQTLQSLRTS